jgi:pyruvate/2-oxoglutarate dehydrogenase complex dihydrolipoamide acyltransferase (E2) component
VRQCETDGRAQTGERDEHMAFPPMAIGGLWGREEMRVDVVLPPLGEDAPDEARVSFWFCDVGATVQEGDDLLEMVTDKASFTVPSPAGGTLVEAAAREGETIKVGQRLGAIETGE